MVFTWCVGGGNSPWVALTLSRVRPGSARTERNSRGEGKELTCAFKSRRPEMCPVTSLGETGAMPPRAASDNLLRGVEIAS